LASEIAVTEAALGTLKLLMEAVGGAGKALERRSKGSPAQRIARFVYWETVYNSLMVDLSRGLMPPRVVATRHEWDQPGRAGALAELLVAHEAATVAAPYLELDSYNQLLGNTIGNIGVRFRGEDRVVIGRLAGLFRDSEMVLRRRLFTADQQKRLGEAITANRPAEPKPLSFLDRITNAAFSVPIWVMFIPNAWLLYNRLMKSLERSRT
jgi:hypothetical protein